jgi:DNA-binding response OmpR family regulator
VHILLATDAQWVVDEVVGALAGPETSFTVCSDGRAVTEVVLRRTPDIAILDLQIGSMGGIAVTMNLRLDESSGRIPHVPVLVLLDRTADVFLARRSGADNWLIKPVNPLALERAVREILNPTASPRLKPDADTGLNVGTDGTNGTEGVESAEEQPAATG